MPKPITVSYSEIDAARQCRFKHQLAYQERWVPPTTSASLARGSLFHEVMENHYLILQREGQNRNGLDIAAEFVEHMLWDNGWTSDYAEIVDWMYRGYIERWGWDEQWEIVAVEHSAVVPLPGYNSLYRLKMKMDLIVRDRMNQGRLLVVDHKSASRMPKGDKDFAFDDQFGLYTWGMRELGHPIHAAVYNVAKTKQLKRDQTLDERFDRHTLYRNDEELDTIAKEALEEARNVYLSRYRLDGDAPRSPNPDTCKWRCDFTDACLFGRKGMGETRQFLRDLGYVQDFTRH